MKSAMPHVPVEPCELPDGIQLVYPMDATAVTPSLWRTPRCSTSAR
jgi:hypothetical protein